MSAPPFRRIVRRETHSPRTVAMIVAVVIFLVVLLWAAVEIVLYLSAQPALLAGPGVAVAWIIGLPTAQPSWLIIAGGAVLASIGIVFLVIALSPGRLSKHEMTWEGRAVVVDNGVIASALAQHISNDTGISPDDITVGVSHRRADVTVRPGYGLHFDADPVRELVATEIADYQLTPRVKTRVRVIRPPESEPAR